MTICSTSMVEMFSPPEMMMSFIRSRSSMAPFGCQTATSPEWNQPPAEGVGGGLRVAEVPGHHDVAPHHHLARRLAVPRHVVHLLVHHPDEVGGDVRLALARQETCPFLVREVPEPGVEAARDRGVRLGQAVDVERGDVQLAHAAEQRRGGRRAARADRQPGGQPVRARVVDQSDLNRGRAVEVGHPFVVDQPPHLGGIHPAQADDRRSDGHRPPREAPAVAVEEGGDEQQPGPGRQAAPRSRWRGRSGRPRGACRSRPSGRRSCPTCS